MQHLALISVIVDDYDKAIQFYTQKLGFTLAEDTKLSDEKRWVVVKPALTNGCGLLLAKATSEEQINAIGHQSGGRVFLFLHTDNILRDIETIRANGIKIRREPMKAEFGTAAVFEDLYGNLWDLVEPKLD